MDVELNEAQVEYAQAILESGVIDLDVLQTWLSNLDEAPNDLGEALCKARLVNEFELTNALSKTLGLSVANEIELEMYATPHPLIPREVCVELLCIPLSDEQSSPLSIACSNPLDQVGLDYLKELIGGGELKLSLAAPSQIRAEITACYGTEEEWLDYLASQGRSPMTSQEDENKYDFDRTASPPSDSQLDSNGRPRSIPDWSSRCPDVEERVSALNLLFDQG